MGADEKIGGFCSKAKSHQKDVNPHFSRKRVLWVFIFPHKIKQKHFFMEKKYETIPRAKKEAAVGNVFKCVLVSKIILIL